MRKNKTKALAALAAAMAALMALSGCAAGDDAVPTQTGPQAIEVHTTTAGYGTIDRQTQFVGRVEAAENVKVYATTSAKVIEANFAPGERVEKGQLLFALDTENIVPSVESARLSYGLQQTIADGTITQAKNAYDNAKDTYDTIKDNEDRLKDAVDYADSARGFALRQYNAAVAALNAARNEMAELSATTPEYEELEAMRVKIAQLQYNVDLLEASYQQAESTYQQARASYYQIEDNIAATRRALNAARDAYENTLGDEEKDIVGTAQGQVDLAKISYDNAVKALNDARVYAPVSGIVSSKNISASDFVSPGAPLYIIQPEGGAPMISFNLSEDGANALSVGSPVTVLYSGQEYPAQITELSTTANPQTGLYAAKAQTDLPLPTSRSGGVVKVQASTAKAENALLLPLDLLEYDGNQPYVYVYRDGTAVRADVVTGISSADDVVILSGVTEADRIITTWHPDLKDGAAVTLAE